MWPFKFECSRRYFTYRKSQNLRTCPRDYNLVPVSFVTQKDLLQVCRKAKPVCWTQLILACGPGQLPSLTLTVLLIASAKNMALRNSLNRLARVAASGSLLKGNGLPQPAAFAQVCCIACPCHNQYCLTLALLLKVPDRLLSPICFTCSLWQSGCLPLRRSSQRQASINSPESLGGAKPLAVTCC